MPTVWQFIAYSMDIQPSYICMHVVQPPVFVLFVWQGQSSLKHLGNGHLDKGQLQPNGFASIHVYVIKMNGP